MGLRPKENQYITFVQLGTNLERKGKVKLILKPEFHRHLTRTQYQVECDDSEDVYLEGSEIINVYR